MSGDGVAGWWDDSDPGGTPSDGPEAESWGTEPNAARDLAGEDTGGQVAGDAAHEVGGADAGVPAGDVAALGAPAGETAGAAATAGGGEAPAPAAGRVAEDLALLARAEATLSAVEQAMRRFDDGNYATCEVCHLPLPPEQLEADPLLARCPLHAA